jgi:predicted nuclease with TOPRIM domain
MSDSIENILIGLVRDSNSHMDKINNSVLSNNKLLQTLIEKVSKVEEENKCLREKMDILVGDNKYIREKMEDTHKIVDELANTNKVLFEKIETLEKPKPITKKLSKVPKEPKLICSMTTAKGNMFTKRCVPG